MNSTLPKLESLCIPIVMDIALLPHRKWCELGEPCADKPALVVGTSATMATNTISPGTSYRTTGLCRYESEVIDLRPQPRPSIEAGGDGRQNAKTKEMKMYQVTRIGKEIICQGIGKPYDASFWQVKDLMTGKIRIVQGRDNLYRRFRPWNKA